MPVIDAHQHFWNLSEVAYPWLTPDVIPLYRTFEPPELEPQLRVAGIHQTVLVQSANSYEENAALLKRADYYEWIAAVVGWVDLLVPEDTGKRLEMYKQHPKFRGVRHLVHNEPNPDWIAQPIVLESLKMLAKYGMVFEVPAVFPDHLKHIPALAEQVPDLRIVIDHLAKPLIKERVIDPWTMQLRDAAALPNVYAKISGLNTAADWETWSAADLKPYVDVAIEVFGAERLMYGSDWPVCLLAGSYQSNWIGTNRMLEGRSLSEIDAILGGTAAKVYGI